MMLTYSLQNSYYLLVSIVERTIVLLLLYCITLISYHRGSVQSLCDSSESKDKLSVILDLANEDY